MQHSKFEELTKMLMAKQKEEQKESIKKIGQCSFPWWLSGNEPDWYS